MIKVGLSAPDITQKEIDMVLDVMKSRFLAMGPKIDEFEKSVKSFMGRKHAVAVNSGTSGLHLAIKSMGIKEGDEVITTPFSFIASSNCILYEKAKPVFVDIDPLTLNIDVNKIEDRITDKTKAILPVHVFGQAVNMDTIERLSNKYNLFIIEDACEAIGGEWKGKKVGTRSHASVLAFYPNKQVTTGEGGVILTDDSKIDELCRSMRNQGRSNGNIKLAYERLGYNYRMDELSAALGIGQMERIEEILQKREAIASAYSLRLKGIGGVSIPYVAPEVTMSWFVYVVKVDEGIDRTAVMEYLLSKGIQCRSYFSPIHLQPFYRDLFGFKPGDFPITERVAKSTIALPFHNTLSCNEIDYVVENLKRGIDMGVSR